MPLRKVLVGELLTLKALHPHATHRVVQASDRIYLSPDGCAWASATTGARRLFRRVLERASIDRVDAAGRTVDLHSLRGSCATRLARRGVPLATTQKILGHSSPVMTSKHYTLLTCDELRSAVEQAARPALPRILRVEAGVSGEASA